MDRWPCWGSRYFNSRQFWEHSTLLHGLRYNKSFRLVWFFIFIYFGFSPLCATHLEQGMMLELAQIIKMELILPTSNKKPYITSQRCRGSSLGCSPHNGIGVGECHWMFLLHMSLQSQLYAWKADSRGCSWIILEVIIKHRHGECLSQHNVLSLSMREQLRQLSMLRGDG